MIYVIVNYKIMSTPNKRPSWEKHLEDSKERAFYSVQRIDLLTISISGACIYIAFEAFKYFSDSNVMIEHACFGWLKLSAISSVLAIITNFISQFTGHHANNYEAQLSRLEIKKIDGENIDDSNVDEMAQRSDSFNSLTNIFNISASVLMAGGIVLLAAFFLLTF